MKAKFPILKHKVFLQQPKEHLCQIWASGYSQSFYENEVTTFFQFKLKFYMLLQVNLFWNILYIITESSVN